MGLLRRMLAGEDSTVGVAGEAVLDHASYVQGAADGSSRGATMRQSLIVRAISRDGVAGPAQRLRVFVPFEVARGVQSLVGERLPVRLDPVTAKVLTIDVPRTKTLLEGRPAPPSERTSWRDELNPAPGLSQAPAAVRALSAVPAAFLGAARGMFKTAEPDDGGIPPGDPALEPIHGVDFDTWVAVEAGIRRDDVPQPARDAYAQSYGVAPGVWPAAASGWAHRRSTDHRMAQRAGTHIEWLASRPRA